jgi:hypothetical protein
VRSGGGGTDAIWCCININIIFERADDADVTSADGPEGNREVTVTLRETRPVTPAGRASAIVQAREVDGFSLGSSRPDVRGWPVYTADGELVGDVDALYIDMRSHRVRYLAIALRDSARRLAPWRVLVPVGCARRYDERAAVVLTSLSSKQLKHAPRIPNRALTRADEDATLAAYDMFTSLELPGNDFYDSPAFSEQLLFTGPRLVS